MTSFETCPKCGEGKMSKPIYVRRDASTGGECLRRYCNVCGYTKTEPTKDKTK